ncbi:protein SOSEKI 5-like [Malania oleifera]|uniref:protein SOSEKI 5-like n=1 Tax=Malania oleifera TaxID=397392 RepID=UPI0025AE8074|nr:protein SOSEKI 5-like [Malania oleifera]
MSVSSSGRMELSSMAKKWQDGEASPERTKVWVENRSNSDRKVAVVYYLCHNGQLEHPHFMEVLLSSSRGLFLRDVMNRLNVLRGKGMANMYSWSSKRTYRNGFVWQDLSENDIIHPVYGHEYVLKGSELLESSSSFRFYKPLPVQDPPLESNDYGADCDSPIIIRRRNQSWSSFDPREGKVYRAESSGDFAGKAADAATQTDDRRLRSRRAVRDEDEVYGNGNSTELSREDISPPPSSSSPEVSSDVANVDGVVNRSRVVVDESADIRNQTAGSDRPSGRMKASAVLMQLISCGSGLVKDGESTLRKNQECLASAEYETRLQRDAWN